MADDCGFVLTRQWRDGKKGVELEYWLATDSGPLKLTPPVQTPVFFTPIQQQSQCETVLQALAGWTCKPVEMKDFTLQPVCAWYFSSQRTLRKARDLLLSHNLTPLESDVKPDDRFLMERFVRGSLRYQSSAKDDFVAQKQAFALAREAKIVASDYLPSLKVVSLDIETAMKGLALFSIGVYARDGDTELKKVFMISDQDVADGIEVFAEEKPLMQRFFRWLSEYDPDVIIGWNIVNFDMWYLERICQKHKLEFCLGRGFTHKESSVYWRVIDEDAERRAMSLSGRVVLDGIELLKAAFYQFESFALNNVASEMLGETKLLTGSSRGDDIATLFFENKKALAEYNIQDCKLVWDIFEKAKLLDFAVARTRITGLPLDRVGGSVASFDFRYLPLLHRQGYVAPNGHLTDDIEHSPGGFVMNSQPGIYDYVAVLDFKSLYPSIIRSFMIDPLGMAIGLNGNLDQKDLVPGYKGAWFAKDSSVLPELIKELWNLRDLAKTNSDAPLSQAIKIIMNSFYGVLGTGGCRFFDSRLASSITRRGHQIIQQTAEFIEEKGWPVIYGDTDSVFVWFKDVSDAETASTFGKQLEVELNTWWKQRLEKEYGVDSALEIEFETLYQRFLMPTVRGSDQGSKKRYAGVVLRDGEPELVFKGLENVRTDWTKLARDFQSELYRRIFFEEPYKEFVKAMVKQVSNGELDSQLVYRKRLRRKLDDYQRNIPPHVQAARKAVSQGEKIRRGDWVEYVITVNGAEPLSCQQSLIDYQHYVDRQLAPAADGILYFKDDSLAAITDQQIGLFG